MGMVLIGRRLSADELRLIADDPAAVDMLIYGDFEDEAEGTEPELDLDKSWHAIHYVLTGTAWQISEGPGAAILGGEPIGDDNGYGPPRLVPVDQVQSIAAGLRTADIGLLRGRWNPDALTEAKIYPGSWSDTDFDSYILPNLTALREFYQAAAAEG